MTHASRAAATATAIAYAPDGRSVAGGELYCGKVFLCTSEWVFCSTSESGGYLSPFTLM